MEPVFLTVYVTRTKRSGLLDRWHIVASGCRATLVGSRVPLGLFRIGSESIKPSMLGLLGASAVATANVREFLPSRLYFWSQRFTRFVTASGKKLFDTLLSILGRSL
jgi:hypothetical protein